MIIINHGQIAHMQLPDGWREHEEPQGVLTGPRSLREFYNPSGNQAHFGLFYRGQPIDDASAKDFQSILNLEPHALSNEERDRIFEVLGNAADPLAYEFSKCSTIELNGKRLLAVEGQYLGSKTNTIELFIDADGSGKLIQQIYFSCPEKDFTAQEPFAREAFSSIKWR